MFAAKISDQWRPFSDSQPLRHRDRIRPGQHIPFVAHASAPPKGAAIVALDHNARRTTQIAR
jgi:hypothetical protein